MENQTFEQEFAKYLPIVYKAKQKYRLYLWELSDYVQEGMLVYFNLLAENHPEDTLPVYFKVRFHQHLINLLRKQNAFKRGFDNGNYTDLEEVHNKVADRKSYLENELILTDTITTFLKQLKKNDQKILLKLIEGGGVSRVQKCRIKQKLLQFLADEGKQEKDEEASKT